jgi:predicted dinucleotide-binding enzyme
MDRLVTPPGSSAAEEISTLLPGASVLKAFNTTFAGTLVEGQVAGHPLDVFVAGDEADAKQRVGIGENGGLRPIDTGPLRRAREREAILVLRDHTAAPAGPQLCERLEAHQLGDLGLE